MIEAQADVALGEAIRPSALAHSQVVKGGLALVVVPALVLAGAIVGSSLIGMVVARISPRLEGFAGLLWIAGALIGLTAALRIVARRQLDRYINGLRRLGSPPTFPTRFRFDDQGIGVDSSRHQYRAPWDSVLFVIPAPEHWLVQVDTMTLAVPRRAFADAAAEQAFVDLASERLEPGARNRSVLVRD